MKRIVICCDGTWDTPNAKAAGVPRATNVEKLAEAVQAHGGGVPQLLHYDRGLCGTRNILRRGLDAAAGAGLGARICEAYRWLAAHYEPGDEIFLFGVGRGAFVVRSLAGLVRNAGVLRSVEDELVARAFALYRDRRAASHPRERAAEEFRAAHAVADVTRIHFVGVWDTVGVQGNPLLLNGIVAKRNDFHDTRLSSGVDRAYQALAIDEKRWAFAPAVWQRQAHARRQVLEQVWFAGTHADVGGGNVDTGLSDIALGWMAERAVAAGLGLGALRAFPDPCAPLTESRTGGYSLLPPYVRPIGPPDAPSGESLHPSVLERYRRQAGYRPSNLGDYFLRHPAQRPVRTHRGSANAMYRSPDGRPSLPPPAATTTNWRPSAS